VGPRAVLNAVVKRKIPSPRRESNPRIQTYISPDFNNIRVKLFLSLTTYHATKKVLGSGGIAPRTSRLLNLGTRWRCVIYFTSRPLYSSPREKFPVPLE
jgi:hypothetical protein